MRILKITFERKGERNMSNRKRKKDKVQKISEEEYARYLCSLKDEPPLDAYEKAGGRSNKNGESEEQGSR